jgi:hypothetical protein
MHFFWVRIIARPGVRVGVVAMYARGISRDSTDAVSPTIAKLWLESVLPGGTATSVKVIAVGHRLTNIPDLVEIIWSRYGVEL